MRIKWDDIIAAFIVGGLVVGALSLLLLATDCESEATDGLIFEQKRLLTQRETQQLLADAGYDIGGDGVDGVVGANTIAAWDKWECQQYADKYNWMYDTEVKQNGK